MTPKINCAPLHTVIEADDAPIFETRIIDFQMTTIPPLADELQAAQMLAAFVARLPAQPERNEE